MSVGVGPESVFTRVRKLECPASPCVLRSSGRNPVAASQGAELELLRVARLDARPQRVCLVVASHHLKKVVRGSLLVRNDQRTVPALHTGPVVVARSYVSRDSLLSAFQDQCPNPSCVRDLVLEPLMYEHLRAVEIERNVRPRGFWRHNKALACEKGQVIAQKRKTTLLQLVHLFGLLRKFHLHLQVHLAILDA